MTLVARPAVTVHRPLSVVLTLVFLAFLGVGAVGGGLAVLFGWGGFALPDEYLDMLPVVDNWVVPGLILLVIFGFGSLINSYGMWSRPHWAWLGWLEEGTGHHWSWLGTILIGIGQVLWITLELVSIPFSFLMPTMGLVGLALALLPWLPSVRRYLEIT